MQFETPWAFLIVLAIPAVVYLHQYRRRGAAFRFSSTRHAAGSGKSLRQRLTVLPLVLRMAALLLLAVALARPQQGRERVRDVSRGVAIEMVVDRSGSMGAEMSFGGERLTRLDVVKRVFEEFVHGNDADLPGRPNDLVGLISFARYADTICPLTLGHGALSRFLENVQLVKRKSEDGTAVGDAMALAAARLKTAEESLMREAKDAGNAYELKSKIMILLTDGQNNRGKRSPAEAAALAKEWGIKAYTIGVGGGEAMRTIQTPFGNYMVPMGSGLDERTLRHIADETGAIYREADDADSLRAVYKEIDSLEKSEFETVRYMDYKEWFAPFALGGLLCLAFEVIARNTLFRRIP